jgi:hypothetical protein
MVLRAAMIAARGVHVVTVHERALMSAQSVRDALPVTENQSMTTSERISRARPGFEQQCTRTCISEHRYKGPPPARRP